VVFCKFLYIPFMASRRACPEQVEGPVLSQSNGSGRTVNVDVLILHDTIWEMEKGYGYERSLSTERWKDVTRALT